VGEGGKVLKTHGPPRQPFKSFRRNYARHAKETFMSPTLSNGKICYLEIPASDIPRSIAFYQNVFGWKVRQRGDGSTAFDDGVGEVSGTWIKDRPPSTQVGLLVYIMVDSVELTIDAVKANGGEIVQEIGGDAPEITARFTDPGGNVFGLYQEPKSQ
jgi:predicted enzyme related to lactoylglutathione lyase